MLVLIPVIHGKGVMSIAFPHSLPSHCEPSEAQKWHIGTFRTGLLVKDGHKPARRLEVGLPFILCQISCSNFCVDSSFKLEHRSALMLDSD